MKNRILLLLVLMLSLLSPTLAAQTATVDIEVEGKKYRVVITINPVTEPVLAAPTELTATLVNKTVRLNWKDNATGETGYGIWRKTSTTDWARVGVAAADATEYTDGTVVPDTSYTYRVRAHSTTASAWSNEVTIRTPAATSPPSSIEREVYGAINLGTREWVRSATGGAAIQFLGKGLGLVPGVVQVAGKSAAVRRWTPEMVEVVIPVVTGLVVGKVEVSGPDWWTTSFFDFSISPGLVETPPMSEEPIPEEPTGPPPSPPGEPPTDGPFVTGYHDLFGNIVVAAQPDQVVQIHGHRFGTEVGSVWYGLTPMPILEWTDTSIQVTVPDLPASQMLPPAAECVTIQRPDQNYYISQSFRINVP